MKRKLVHGVGLNDILKSTNKDSAHYHFYQRWVSLLNRCYSPKSLLKRSSYSEAMVIDDWLLFSNFKAWMEDQDWEGKHLDKDLLYVDNKLYSPDTCVFIHPNVNSFVTESTIARGNYPLGVYLDKESGKFKSQCQNMFTKKRENLGRYNTPEEAHLAWKARKHELACQLADSEYVTDDRVREALRNRYKTP